MLDQPARDDLKRSIDWMVSIQAQDGNFPSSFGKIGKYQGEDELVHWCHGAPGVIQLLISAYVTYKEKSYLASAIKASNLIYQKGLLRKGPGICHGVAGNGYCFLFMYRLTGQQEYLDKARTYAYVLMDPKFEVNL